MESKHVLVEMRVPRRASAKRLRKMAGQLSEYGFDWDPDYLVPHELSQDAQESRSYRHVLLRGQIEEDREPELEAQPNVIRVWSDAPIVSFENDEEDEKEPQARPKSPFAF